MCERRGSADWMCTVLDRVQGYKVAVPKGGSLVERGIKARTRTNTRRPSEKGCCTTHKRLNSQAV